MRGACISEGYNKSRSQRVLEMGMVAAVRVTSHWYKPTGREESHACPCLPASPPCPLLVQPKREPAGRGDG